MPFIEMNDMNVYYEITGQGSPIVFIHGAFVSLKMWEPQIEHFSKKYQVITMDLRGHGKTGLSPMKKYSVELFAFDLHKFLEVLKIKKPIICGLSLGGMIAQVYATEHPNDYSALILADTAATITLTKWDYLMRYFVGPKWLMLLSLRLLGVHRMIKFQFWMAKFTRSKEWLGNEAIINYEKSEMLEIDKKEYLKIFGSLYDFKLQPLERIKVPTLVINGKYEPKSIFKHAEKIKSLIENCEVDIIDNTGHVTNMENPKVFNKRIDEFLKTAL